MRWVAGAFDTGDDCSKPRSSSASPLHPCGGTSMLKVSDLFILLAVGVSFAVSAYLWFNGNREEGLFTAMWVPSILAFGIYFKLAVVNARVAVRVEEKTR